MASEAVTDGVRRLFVQALNIEVRSVETDLIDSGLLDSLALVELLFQIEQEFEVDLSLDDLDIESFRTVERIGEFIESSKRANAV